MAVARMRKVEVVGHSPVMEDVIAALQRAGVLQVEAAPEGLATAALEPEDDRLGALEEYTADARFVRDFLGRYHHSTQPFSAFISEKFHVGVEDFAALEGAAGLLGLYEHVSEISERLAAGRREAARLRALIRSLEPWAGVRLQISEWRCTEHVTLVAGTVPATEGPRIREVLRQLTPLASVAEYGAVGAREAWLVLTHCSEAEQVRSALAATRFEEVAFEGLSGYPAEETALAEERLASIEADIEAAELEAAALSDQRYESAVVMTEVFDSERAATTVLERFGRTERTFVVTGWVRASRTEDLEAALEPWADSLDVTLRDPTDEEDPPVELSNPRILRPFEVLTDLYGRPGYREIDPTPLLAPFFLLFFAICIGDVGYGAMLAGGAWLIKNRLDVAPGVKRFMDLMMIGGAGAMVIGVLFGSWLALPIESLPGFMRQAQVLDPLAGLQIFLVATVVLGIVQVFFGVSVAAYDSFRRGDPASAVFEQMSTIFLFGMIGVSVWRYMAGDAVFGQAALAVGLLGTMLMQGRTFEAALGGKGRPAWDRYLGLAWLLAMVSWVFSLAFSGPSLFGWSLLAMTVGGLAVSKTVRRSVVAFLAGAYAVYSMSAFLGDILSYTRLAALGLSGTLVGLVFNILAGLVWGPVAGLWASGGLGWVWAVLVAVCAAAVFVFGHTFNVVINLLGAFVHPARLQFVEFFSKFYQGGGRALNPFRFVTSSVVLNAGDGRRGGGAKS